MPRRRIKPLTTSSKDWLRQLLLARLRKFNRQVANDAALRDLASMAARKVATPDHGYGEINMALSSAGAVIKALEAVDRHGAKGPITASELRRLREASRLPAIYPWF